MGDNMNVLYITHSDDRYGAAKSCESILRNIVKYDVRPTVISLKNNRYNEISDELNIKNYIVTYVPCAAKKCDKFRFLIKAIKYFLVNTVAQRKILKIVDEEKIDIIHINTSVIDVGMLAKKRRNIQLIWHIREFLDLDYNNCFFRKNQIERMRHYGDGFIFISNAVKNHWISKGIGDKGVVVYNGIDIGEFTYNNQGCVDRNRINIAFVGSISPNKGQYQLIDAIAEMSSVYQKKVHAYFYGTGSEEYEQELRQKTIDAGIEEQITFAGFSEHISEELRKCTIGVVASKAEGFGRVTVEYMLSGIFVIASNSGANVELIEERKTGLLFQYGSAKDLCDKICWGLDHMEEIEAMRMNAYRMARERFSEEHYVQSIYDFYEEMSDENKA